MKSIFIVISLAIYSLSFAGSVSANTAFEELAVLDCSRLNEVYPLRSVVGSTNEFAPSLSFSPDSNSVGLSESKYGNGVDFNFRDNSISTYGNGAMINLLTFTFQDSLNAQRNAWIPHSCASEKNYCLRKLTRMLQFLDKFTTGRKLADLNELNNFNHGIECAKVKIKAAISIVSEI